LADERRRFHRRGEGRNGSCRGRLIGHNGPSVIEWARRVLVLLHAKQSFFGPSREEEGMREGGGRP
ncbi:MAG TPA: hypothetical protein PLT27_06310, partial [Nitrospira sp.]|nr:hypothetical protein [Nitrospira sp.]